MKSLISVIAFSVVATAASAQPSQHPRVGQLATVEFRHGSADLVVHGDTALARDLGEVAAWAQDNPDGLLVLDGHTSPIGSRPYNRRLSIERARVVREQLVALDVDPDQIVIAAFGETGPRRARHRKVVIWGTRAGLDAVVARSEARGEPVITTGIISQADLPPQPGAVATR